ncbi:Os02g0454950 [Oryza sativa Japonica Group]|uniref:Os02g0454950 protein n=1 Tax=Oryza sativa subsp. japonica TaxID=39947 RepID=A0A0P0VIP1_ORYSJ|nr:hypothetical protein EE612_011116 [Oryza sativa]KAF2944655.1 hypothetical protein DAI22_02g158800 [Oryza sativa Japonica Group]BAS78520.1 Os02g0454950 [Oryza sativa Japonica Group]
MPPTAGTECRRASASIMHQASSFFLSITTSFLVPHLVFVRWFPSAWGLLWPEPGLGEAAGGWGLRPFLPNLSRRKLYMF